MARQLYDRRMTFYTEYLTFKTAKHREYINMTPQVESALRKSKQFRNCREPEIGAVERI